MINFTQPFIIETPINDLHRFMYRNNRIIDAKLDLDTSNCKCTHKMVCRCKRLTSLTINNFSFNKVEDASFMFAQNPKLQKIEGLPSTLSFPNTYALKNMFWNDNSLVISGETLTVDAPRVSRLDGMFNGVGEIPSAINFNVNIDNAPLRLNSTFARIKTPTKSLTIYFNNSNSIQEAPYCFFDTKFASLDLTNLDITSLYNCEGMFKHAHINSVQANWGDLGNRGKTIYAKNMFYRSRIGNISEISSSLTCTIYDAHGMFQNCGASYLDVRGIHDEVTDGDNWNSCFANNPNLRILKIGGNFREFINTPEEKKDQYTNMFGGLHHCIIDTNGDTEMINFIKDRVMCLFYPSLGHNDSQFDYLLENNITLI